MRRGEGHAEGGGRGGGGGGETFSSFIVMFHQHCCVLTNLSGQSECSDSVRQLS